MATKLAQYDPQQSYDWNYQHAPPLVELGAEVDLDTQGDAEFNLGNWLYAGLPVSSPLAMAAGPLLNSGWILHYARLGFDVLTYKTVRRVARESYPLPNLQPVSVAPPSGDSPHGWRRKPEPASPGAHDAVLATDHATGSWEVSFGMPSQLPAVWQADVRRARDHLTRHKILSVSVVATPTPEMSCHEIVDDYAECALAAAASGADVIELNCSCPNVATCDGQLYQQPDAMRVVVSQVRQAIGAAVPLLIKIGHVAASGHSAANGLQRHDSCLAERLVEQVSPYVQGIVMVNCIAARVLGSSGAAYFGGQTRGIAGRVILPASVDQVERFVAVIRRHGSPLQVIGCGGITDVIDARRYLEAGAQAVQLATAPMLNPMVGLQLRKELRTWLDSTEKQS